ncbi:hypothetical protein E2C01_073174 [Portunus trituberculatus]|uniref:Uncharacterized protein n=1 Tax=Portunus trituberculatus TaxID=210409 RepID=A0A5B7I033_PORTR|nr:hypothetical protein [Portunus trituberculatus]
MVLRTAMYRGTAPQPELLAPRNPTLGTPGRGEHFPQPTFHWRDGERVSLGEGVPGGGQTVLVGVVREEGTEPEAAQALRVVWGDAGPGVFHSSKEGMRDCEGWSSGMAGGGRPPRPHAFYSCFLPTCDPLPSLYGNLWGRPQGHMCAPAAGCPGLCLLAACFSNLSRLSPPLQSSSCRSKSSG